MTRIDIFSQSIFSSLSADKPKTPRHTVGSTGSASAKIGDKATATAPLTPKAKSGRQSQVSRASSAKSAAPKRHTVSSQPSVKKSGAGILSAEDASPKDTAGAASGGEGPDSAGGDPASAVDSQEAPAAPPQGSSGTSCAWKGGHILIHHPKSSDSSFFDPRRNRTPFKRRGGQPS